MLASIRRAADAPSPLNARVGIVPASAARPDDSDGAACNLRGRQEQLVAEVAGALRANLARGYLESEERIREVAEALNDVILLSDQTDGRVFFANVAYEQVWGCPRADLYANPLAFLEAVHPEDRDRVRATFIGQVRQEFDVEFRIVRPSGDERRLWTRGFVVRGGDTGHNRIASITSDITERRQIAASHDRLIRGFTHDVKIPLGAADGYLSLLEAGVFGPVPDAQAQAIGHARRSIRTAVNLVSGLLEIERAQSGQLEIRRGLVDLGGAITETFEEFRPAAAAKDLSATCLAPSGADAVVVESDAARVRQILANLVSNAVKYTQAGGRVSGTARLAPADEAPWAGCWAEVTVIDNGPGISVDNQALVFREFTRFDPGAAAGSGIGLAISRRLAHALGGDITFTSAPGVGSTFTLWLPLESSPTAAPSSPAQRAEERA